MRKAILLLNLVTVIPFSHYGQSASNHSQPSTYVFDHFIDGTVLLKTGAIEPASLNYDADNQSIIYTQTGQYMILTGLEKIDTVYIQEKKFIPAEDKFYEVGTYTPIGLFISYTYKTHPVVANADHNGTSRQTNNQVSNNVSDAYTTRRYEGRFDVEFQKQYWLRRGHSFYKANTETQITKVFPAKADA